MFAVGRAALSALRLQPVELDPRAAKLYLDPRHRATSPLKPCRHLTRTSNPTPHPISSRACFRSPEPGSSWDPLPARIANAPFTAYGLTPSNSPPLKSQTPNTSTSCAPQDCSLRRSGTIRISAIPNSPSPASPGSKPTITVNGCPHTPAARTVFPPKPNGSAPLAAISSKRISPGATTLRNLFPTTPRAGKPDPKPSPATPPTPSDSTTFATTSMSGAAIGTIPTTTSSLPTTIHADPTTASAKPLAADRGAIT